MFTSNDTHNLGQLIDMPSADLRTVIHDISTRSAYERFVIPKANGQSRIITAPKPLLKKIQRRIIPVIEPLPLPNAVHGFRRGRSIVTGAKMHLNARAMVSIDLKDFFHSVGSTQVHSALTKSLKPRLVDDTEELEDQDADTLIQLITFLVTYPLEEHKDALRVLPQGAPTSPYLANLAARPLDISIRRFLQTVPGEFAYTRYADDLTITAPHEIDRSLLGALLQVIHRSGFKANQQKVGVTCTLKGSPHFAQKLMVTGLILDHREGRVRIPKARLERIRLTLHQASLVPVLEAEVLQSIEGSISFVHMVYGKLPASIDRAYEKFVKAHKQAKLRPGKSRKRARQSAMNPHLYA